MDEEDEIVNLIHLLPKGYPVLELGGGKGLVRSKLKDFEVTSIEANPHFTFNPQLVSYTDGTFYIDKHYTSSSQKKEHCPDIQEVVQLPVVRVRDILTQRSHLICDIEGTEIDMIQYDIAVLQKYVVYAIIEFHSRSLGKEVIEKAIARMQQHGLSLFTRTGDICLFVNCG